MYNKNWRAGRVIAGPGRLPASCEAGDDRGREESPDTVLRHVDHFAGVVTATAEWLAELLTGQRAW